LVEARRDAEALLSDPWDDGFKVTMGRLERQLRHELQGDLELISDLIKAVQLRNHLAHAFWRERSDDFCSEAGRARMITDLIEARRFFKDVDARLTASAGAAAFGQWGVTAAAVNAWHADTVGRIERGELDVPPDMVEAARTAMLARIRAASVDAKGRPDR
jgi:hypothetical protein